VNGVVPDELTADLVIIGGGPSPVRCVMGCFDARSTFRGPNGACCRRAFSNARSARILVERPLQKPGVLRIRHAVV